MPLTISPISPRTKEAAALLEASQALMAQLFPPEENHALDLEALCDPSVTFYAAEEGTALLGCVALQRCDDYAEVKSLFVAPEARGIGLGARLLAHVERVAREEGIPVLRLETGHRLMAAGQLYRRQGFTARGPFGAYPASPSSAFYEKPLA